MINVNFQPVTTPLQKLVLTIAKYFMLAVTLGLLAVDLRLQATIPHGYRYDTAGNGIVALMLLFNLLAYQFKFSRPMTVMLRVLSWVMMAFGLFYMFYWVRVLYPL